MRESKELMVPTRVLISDNHCLKSNKLVSFRNDSYCGAIACETHFISICAGFTGKNGKTGHLRDLMERRLHQLSFNE